MDAISKWKYIVIGTIVIAAYIFIVSGITLIFNPDIINIIGGIFVILIGGWLLIVFGIICIRINSGNDY